ncbi:transcription factor bHLH112-like isoform X2 [Benincasa hispida]|uniref:transcription factor bHLH112-like isoform X2 n=1 Tax=Benincasa hispida TaxID=102211 RepID=UPI0019012182|nr:transcription factor bHLH112-like isoform X2 [Benincasa hispida]
MAEDFQTPICGDNWWSSSRSMLVAVGGLSPCSVGIADLSWPPSDDFLDIKPKSAATDSDNNNNSSMLFQDYSTFQMMGFALSSSTTSDHWNQSDNLLNSNGIPTNFCSENGMKEGNDGEGYLNCSSTNTTNCQAGLFPVESTLYGYSSPSTNLYDDDRDPHPLFNSTPTVTSNSTTFPPTNNPNHLSLSSTPNFPCNYLVKPSLSNPSPHLHFTNNTPFWNASSSNTIPQGIASLLEDNNPKSQNTTLAFKCMNRGNSEDGQDQVKKGDKNSAITTEPAVFKRPRIETPSPLPTFKVRKEKLGDRVTALQQLVSPFGKTDTASVLHEAIEYIKFLHDQVLSTPYMKSNNGITPVQHQQQVSEKANRDSPKQDLKSRGLCLVPISSTFPVTNATTADFWTPTFGGTFR